MATKISRREQRLIWVACAVALFCVYGVARYNKEARQTRAAQYEAVAKLEQETAKLKPPASPRPGPQTLQEQLDKLLLDIEQNKLALQEKTQGFTLVHDNASLNRHRSLIAKHAEQSGLVIMGSKPVKPQTADEHKLIRSLSQATGSDRMLEQWTTRGHFHQLTAFMATLGQLKHHASAISMKVESIQPSSEQAQPQAGASTPPLEAVFILLM